MSTYCNITDKIRCVVKVVYLAINLLSAVVLMKHFVLDIEGSIDQVAEGRGQLECL